MYPRYHIILGVVFTLILWSFVPQINWIFLVLLFISSFLIDLDHYINSIIKTGTWSLKNSFEYYKKLEEQEKEDIRRGIKRKSDFHLFHTIEFLFLIGIIGVFFIPFFYIFIGMVFHSLLDLIDLIERRALHRREFFFFNWLVKKI